MGPIAERFNGSFDNSGNATGTGMVVNNGNIHSSSEVIRWISFSESGSGALFCRKMYRPRIPVQQTMNKRRSQNFSSSVREKRPRNQIRISSNKAEDLFFIVFCEYNWSG
jgi:hypothetical protein